MTVLLANPNTSAATTAEMVRIVGRVLTAVTGWTAPEGPAMITGPAALDHAAGLVAALDPPPSMRGVIVAGFGDPGRAALARRIAVPVIGIGAAAARAAARHGSFAVVTTTPDLAPPIDALMAEHGAGATYLGCRVTAGDPVALIADPGSLDTALLGAIQAASAAGAGCVVIGGGPLGAAADRLAARISVPLVNPLIAAAHEMQAALGERGA